MSFIDSYSRQFSLLVDDLEMAAEMVQLAVFWCDVQQPCERVSAFEIGQDSLLRGVRSRTVDGLHFDLRRPQAGDLIVHQGKKWRDDNGDSKINDCRKLIAQGLAKAGRCLEENVMAFECCCHNLALDWSDRGQIRKCRISGPAYLNVSLPKTLRSVKSISTFWPSLRPGTPYVGMTAEVDLFSAVVGSLACVQKERQDLLFLASHVAFG